MDPFEEVEDDEADDDEPLKPQYRKDLSPFLSAAFRPYIFKSRDKTEGYGYKCKACLTALACKNNSICHAMSHMTHENTAALGQINKFTTANARKVARNLNTCLLCDRDIKSSWMKMKVHMMTNHVLDWNAVVSRGKPAL